jgi:hypothetical protein
MKKTTFHKKLRLDAETLQVLTRDQIDGARGGFAQTGFPGGTGGGGTGGGGPHSASCGMGCDHDTRA